MSKISVLLGLITLIAGYSIAKNPWDIFPKVSNDFSKKIQNAKDANPSNSQHIKHFNILSKALPEELINFYNYNGEKHVVTTADGYIITLHRIIGNKDNPKSEGKPAVLLQHGLYCSAMTWLISGPGRSLAFILADLGFDVWLGNFRGSSYSRAHKTLDTSQHEFWNFSWHELGKHDLPAMIDYILEKTKNKKIIYIGHSQGTTSSYVLLSERPEYNDKISSLISLAPVSFFNHVTPFGKFMAQTALTLNMNINNKYYEVKGLDEKTKKFNKDFCNKLSFTHQVCKNNIFLSSGFSEEQYDVDLYSLVFQHYPASASIKQALHYSQIMLSGHFRQYDYGNIFNMHKYHSLHPPDYKLKNIKVPTTLFYSNNDFCTAAKDVKKLYEKLPNPNGLYRVNHATFNHLDFLWGKDVKQLVYDNLISLLLQDLMKSNKLTAVKNV